VSADDAAFGKFLLDRGLLAPDEYEEAERERRASGRPLAEILVAKRYLNPVQVADATAAMNRRVRFCAQCRGPVYVTRLMEEGERCPRCLGPLEWQAEAVVAQIRDLDKLVELTKDELPPDVRAARSVPGRIFGKYILLQEVGRGGAGVVHKAWDTMLAEYVALKFVRDPGPAPESDRQARREREERILDLLQEARAALRLRHEHIVAVRDLGRVGDQFYIAMDYVEGRTLADDVREAQRRGLLSPLYEDPVFYLGVLRDVANAIHYAHTFPKPIVHCDLKPGNILLSTAGTAYVMDFGLARAFGRGSAEAGEGDDRVRGTPSYMAPEQLSGRGDRIGPWTDVYALGATLYELLAGRPPFTGEPLDVLVRALREDPDRPTDVARRASEGAGRDSTKILTGLSKLEEICLRSLAREPAGRYGSARQVAEELGRVIEAVEAGHEKGFVPPRLKEAQERAEIRRVDEEITHLRLEEAERQLEKLRGRRDTTRMRHRLADLRQQMAFVERFRGQLVERLNAARPTFPRLALFSGPLENVEVLKATPRKLYLLVGEVPREAEWSALPAAQVADMAEAVGLTSPADRLALGILCHHARQTDRARAYLESLAGTEYEEAARQVTGTAG
jgi:serine/threonine protein kinase